MPADAAVCGEYRGLRGGPGAGQLLPGRHGPARQVLHGASRVGKGGKTHCDLANFYSILSSVVDPDHLDADPDLYLMRIRIFI
jgi:hypothetical protein